MYFLPTFLICIPLPSHATQRRNQDHIRIYGKPFLGNVIFNRHLEGHLMTVTYFIQSEFGFWHWSCRFLTTRANTGQRPRASISVHSSDFLRTIPRSGIAGSKAGNIFKALGVYYPVAFQNGCAISYQQCTREPNWGNLYFKKAFFNTSGSCWSCSIPILCVTLHKSPKSTVVVCAQGAAGHNVCWPRRVTQGGF